MASTLYSPYSDEMIAMLSKEHVILAMAADFFFDSGTTRVHTGIGNIVLNGFVYTGLGDLGSIDAVSEENTTSPSSLSLTLSGLNSALLSQALNENCVNREFNGYLLALNEDGTVQVADLVFKGFISENYATLGNEDSAINFKVSNIFEKWDTGFSNRYTDESHRQRYPNDRIFRYVAQMSERSIYWGSKKDAPPFNYA